MFFLRNIILSIGFLLATLTSYASTTFQSPELYTQPLEVRLTFDRYKMPDNIATMGVIGIHALANFTPNWYGGIGFYGSISGQNGGYFALSLDGGYQHKITGPLWFDIGNNIGSGGGKNAPVGGGLYIQPHVGLSYHTKYFSIGPYYSYVNFFDGGIKSNQFGISLSLPTSASYADPSYYGISFVSKTDSPSFTLSKNYLAILGQLFIPKNGTTDTSGNVNDNNIKMVGIELGHFINKHALVFAQITGAFSGRINGFASALFGIGYQLPLAFNNNIKLAGKLGVGSAGGGNVETGGGFIIHPQLGLEYSFNKSLAASLYGGYLDAPKGDFKVKTIELGLKYYFTNTTLGNHDDDNFTNEIFTYHDWRIRLLNQTYFNPRANDGSSTPCIQLLNLNLDYYLNSYFYATGQTAFAYDGKGLATGGYFSGMLGMGLQTPKHTKLGFSSFGEILFGTAGGIKLDIGSGALIEPILGINYQITPYWGLQASIGRLIALHGDFNTTTLNAGLTYKFALLEK